MEGDSVYNTRKKVRDRHQSRRDRSQENLVHTIKSLKNQRKVPIKAVCLARFWRVLQTEIQMSKVRKPQGQVFFREAKNHHFI